LSVLYFYVRETDLNVYAKKTFESSKPEKAFFSMLSGEALLVCTLQKSQAPAYLFFLSTNRHIFFDFLPNQTFFLIFNEF